MVYPAPPKGIMPTMKPVQQQLCHWVQMSLLGAA